MKNSAVEIDFNSVDTWVHICMLLNLTFCDTEEQHTLSEQERFANFIDRIAFCFKEMQQSSFTNEQLESVRIELCEQIVKRLNVEKLYEESLMN